jgi:hypothetical protein
MVGTQLAVCNVRTALGWSVTVQRKGMGRAHGAAPRVDPALGKSKMSEFEYGL